MMPGFAVAALDGYLKAHIAGLEGTPRLARIAGGQSNPTFFVDYDKRSLVLRKKPPGPLLPSAHAIDREFRVMQVLGATHVPVPPVLLYEADETIIGTPFYVMAKVEGQVFHECTLPGLRPEARQAAYLSIIEAMAALHNVVPADVGLSDFGRPDAYFARQIGRWSRQWRENRTREDAHMERLIAELPGRIPKEEPLSIVHGDFRVGNMLLAPDGRSVAAILDWELSTLGHPLADLAHFAMAWESLPAEYGGVKGLDLEALGIPALETVIAHYAAHARHGVGLQPFHMAFAFFRWAAIFEGIAARVKAGTASAENAGETAHLAGVFAERATQYL